MRSEARVGWRRDNAIPPGEFMKQALLVALVIASRTPVRTGPGRHGAGIRGADGHDTDAGRSEAPHPHLRPAGHSEALPFLLIRTPYGIEGATPEFPRLPKGTRRGRLHLRLSGHSGTIRIGRAIRHEPSRSIPRASMRAPTPRTRSTGCSTTSPTTAVGWASSVSAIRAGSRRWRGSIPIRRSRRSHHRRR